MTMLATPETEYAVAGDTHIAYQTTGVGAPLMLAIDWFSHLDAMWEWPPYAGALRRLAGFSRFAAFDKRGVGLSDPAPAETALDLDSWMHDVVAVMDAAGFERADFLAVGAGGPMSMTFAAEHPDRVNRLILVNSYARLLAADDYAPGWPARARDTILATCYSDASEAATLNGDEADPDFARWWRRYQRQSVSPSVAAAVREMMFRVDVRHVLDSIHAPTLVLHRMGDRWIRFAHGEYLAEHIPDARFVGLPGSEDLFFQGDVDALLDEVERFLGGDPDRVGTAERVLATVLFTDLVGSTRKAAALGDAGWCRLLDNHDAVTANHVLRNGGTLIKSTGDGLVATFDGPRSAMQAAADIRDDLRSLGLRVRCGLHTGEVERRGADISGIAVHLGARVTSLAEADQILVTSTVKQLVTGSELAFRSIGTHDLRGIPDTWEIFELDLGAV